MAGGVANIMVTMTTLVFALTVRPASSAGSRLAARSWTYDGSAQQLSSLPRAAAAGKCDRDSLHSPYRLQYYSTNRIPGGNVVCFHVLLVPCDPQFQCCSGQDLFKAEFDVEPTCKHSLTRLTLDGEEHDFEFNAAQRRLRVTNLQRHAANAAGTQICLTLRGQCTDLAALCAAADGQCRYSLSNGGKRDCCPTSQAGASPPPSPPPPPPPQLDIVTNKAVAVVQQAGQQQHAGSSSSNVATSSTTSAATSALLPASEFPYAQCQRDAARSRYSLSDARVSPFLDPDSDDLTRICFTVDARRQCSGGSSPGAPNACCEFDLQKVEFDVSAECYGALSYVSVGGQKRPPFFQTLHQPAPTVKVVNLNLPAASAHGAEVCLFLRPQCSTLQQLCRRPDGRCQYSIFGAQPPPGTGAERCCPVGLAGSMAPGAEAGVTSVV